MRELQWRRVTIGALMIFALAAYAVISARMFVASRLLRSWEPQSLMRAAQLDPTDAEPWRRLARLKLFVSEDAPAAADAGRQAVIRNPRDANAWLDVALADETLGRYAEANHALARALRAAPTTPVYLLAAANAYFSAGEQTPALIELRIVAEHEPDSLANAVDLAWRATHDAARILREVVPGNTEGQLALLRDLAGRDEPAAAATVWKKIRDDGKNFEPQLALPYVNYLLQEGRGREALEVWSAPQMQPLAAYRRPENLVANPGFEQDILNSGVDWRLQNQSGVAPAISTHEHHSGARSLQLEFSGAVGETGAWQYIPLTAAPSREYQFSAFYRSENFDGAGGLAWAIVNPATGAVLAQSGTMAASAAWQKVEMQFKSPETDLVILKLLRDPPGDQLRGSLWLDDVSVQPRR